MGQTRSGKSYLVRHGILPLCQWDRVLIIDVKGDDKTLTGLGKPIRQIPRLMPGMRKLIREERPRDNWYRLVATNPDWGQSREQVATALQTVRQQGDWVVIVDELRAITDPQPPGLRLAPIWEELMLRGGSRGISMVNLTQEPRWVRGSFYTGAQFFWLSKIEDEAAQKRVAEIGSSRGLLPHIQRVPRHNWIYMDNQEDERFYARTKVGK